MISNSSYPSMDNQFTFQIITKNNDSYSIIFSLRSNIIEINVSNNNLNSNYETSLETEDFYKINKYFKQFDSIEEIYDFIIGLDNIENNTTIDIEQNFLNLNISLPTISKGRQNTNILIKLSSFNINKNEIINKLNEKDKEIKILKEKIDYLMNKLCSPGEFELYKEAKKLYDNFMKNNMDISKSKIIKSEMDFVPILIGLKQRLNKSFDNMKLIYRASRDGDSSKSFHTYCDGKENTLFFIKDRNGRRFGAFANKEWNCDGKWICDSNAFLFSLDHHECYFSKSNNVNGKILYGDESYGPLFGEDHDLYICDNCLSKKNTCKQHSFDYKGKKNALCGSNIFYLEDYETYQLILS